MPESPAQMQHLFQTAIKNAPLALIILDKAGTCVYANTKFNSLTGYTLKDVPTAQEWMTKAYPDPKLRQKVSKEWELACLEGKITERTFPVQCADGSTKHIHFHTSFTDTHCFVNLEDATAQVDYTERLRLSEQNYRAIFNGTADAIIIHDVSTSEILDANRAFFEMYGFDHHDLKQLIVEDFSEGEPPYDQEAAMGIIKRAASGEIVHFEWRDKRKSGELFWTDNTARKVEIDGYTRVLVVARDITDRKIAQQALIASEKRYRNIFDNSLDGYYRTDINGRILLVNKAAVDILGFDSPDEILGRDVASDFYENPEARKDFLRRLLKEKKILNYNNSIRAQNGEFRELEISSHLVVDQETGAPVGVEGLFRDVTGKKRMQELLVQSEKMLSVGGLAAGMAHEINNPLGGILQGVQNVLRRISPEIQANQKAAERVDCSLESMHSYFEDRRIITMLEGIKDSGERAAKIVKNMLRFSRKSDVEHEPTDLNELIEDVLGLAGNDYDLKKHYDFRRLDVKRSYDPSLPEIPMNPTEISQVILNVVRNAAQAMADCDHCDAHPQLKVTTITDGDKVRITIEDNGPGMPEEQRRRVFEPFFTTKQPGTGTGLGLSVSYFIVTQNHGGEFHVDSTPGKGTTFTIDLPLTTPDGQASGS